MEGGRGCCGGGGGGGVRGSGGGGGEALLGRDRKGKVVEAGRWWRRGRRVRERGMTSRRRCGDSEYYPPHRYFLKSLNHCLTSQLLAHHRCGCFSPRFFFFFLHFDIAFPSIIIKSRPLCVCKYFQDVSPSSQPPTHPPTQPGSCDWDTCD